MEVSSIDEIQTLRNENRVLQGKIRGYQTLGQLFKELKEKNKILEMNQQKDMVSVATGMDIELFGSGVVCGSNTTENIDPGKLLSPSFMSLENQTPLLYSKFFLPAENSESPEEINVVLRKKMEDALQLVEEYERKRSNDKKLVKILNEEIKKTKDELKSIQEKYKITQQENDLLLMKIKKLEQERDHTTLNIGAINTQAGETEGTEDWVHLRQENLSPNFEELDKETEIQQLVKKCKELEGKATRWEREHFNIQREYTKHTAELRCLLESKSKELVKVTEAQNSEKKLLELKFKKLETMYLEEKDTNLAAKHNYQETLMKYRTLEKKFLSLEQKNKTSSWEPTDTKENLAIQMNPASVYTDQILMLKQQVELFKDDFEKERKERIFAQRQQKDFEDKLFTTVKQLEKKTLELEKCEKSLAEERAKTEKLIEKLKTLEVNYKRVNNHNLMLMEFQTKMPQANKMKEVLPTSSSGLRAAEVKMFLKSKSWTCECCTFINNSHAKNCEICKAPHPAARTEKSYDEDLEFDGPCPKFMQSE